MAKKKLVLKPGGPVVSPKRRGPGRPVGSPNRANGLRRELLELASALIALATKDW